MNSQGINSTRNKNQPTSNSPLSKKAKPDEADQGNNDSSSVAKMKTGRKRILFHLLIGYQ